MNITDSFLDRLSETAELELTPTLLHQVERCLLDYTGVLHAGRKQLRARLAPALRAMAEDRSFLSGARGRDFMSEAMANGFAAHYIELDDGHRIGAPHLEAVTISAMLALAQQERLPFERFVKGVLIGYEATIRLSTALQPSHKLRGFHSTGTCGTVGVACAAGFALGLDRERLKSAISAAASGAAGILQVLDDNSELKPYNVANAIRGGLTAACFGTYGFRGPDDVLGGKRGFLRAFSDEARQDALLDKTEKPAIFQIYVKPYASCRHSHPAVECALALRRGHTIVPSEIDDVEVQTYGLGILGHDQTEVSSISAAKMSTPYSVAASLVLGSCGMEAFSEAAIARQDIRDTVRKVRVVENERLTRACPAKRGAIVTLRLRNGQVFEQEVENPLGEPENSISDAQLEEKYGSLMAFAGFSTRSVEQIKTRIWNLEDSYEELIKIITEDRER